MTERVARMLGLLKESHKILDEAIFEYVADYGKRLAGVVILFSGGTDSTTLAHMMRFRATHAAHANTTVGIEQTRQFVRDTCINWGLPLLEFKPPRETDHYRALVLDQGFPGPAQHFKMYQRLKERSLREVRRELVSSGTLDRVVFLAGRRRSESARRIHVPASERVGSVVWVSPLVNWTTEDLNTYRLQNRDIPRNEVADLLHMSGECLCGSFAKQAERGEIEAWFPDAFNEIAELEQLISGRDDIPAERRTWGWGAFRDQKTSKSGPLCSSCDAKA